MGGSVRFVSVLAILELTIRIPALIPDSLVLHSLMLVKQSLKCESFATLFAKMIPLFMMDGVNMLLQYFVFDNLVTYGTLSGDMNPVVVLI